jgi:hypothetical protein
MSDNRQYSPYTVEVSDVLEIWNAKAFFTTKIPELESNNLSVPVDHLALTEVSQKEEIKKLK